MKFDEFDKKMRVYEQSIDQVMLPEIYLAERLGSITLFLQVLQALHFPCK